MKRSEFSTKNTKEKIEYLSSQNKTIFDLLKVDISSLEDTELMYIYDLSETYAVISDQAKPLADKLDAVAETAAARFYDALEQTDLSEEVKSISVEIFKATIVPAIEGCADYLSVGYKKVGNYAIDRLAAAGVINILEKIIDFRKRIDAQFPGVSDVVISAAANGLITLVGLYSPTISATLNSIKLVENVETFLKVDSLEDTIKTLNSRLDEIKKDKQLAEIHKTGEKIGELSTKTLVPVEALQKIGFNLSTIEKTISQVDTQASAKEFIKYLGTTADKMPATTKELSENLQNLATTLLKAADDSGLKKEAKEKFETTLKAKIQEVEKIYSQSFEKDKNIFEKIVLGQTATNTLSSAIKEFKAELTKTSQNKAIAETFGKKANLAIKEALPNLSQDVIKQARKAPTLAKELGLNLKIEVEINKSTQQSASR